MLKKFPESRPARDPSPALPNWKDVGVDCLMLRTDFQNGLLLRPCVHYLPERSRAVEVGAFTSVD